MSYQWRKGGASISGATLSTYTIASVQTNDAGIYAVKVTNAKGSVTSADATLTVLVPPAITTQPQSRAVAVGGNVTLTVVASGTVPLGYQWRFNGTALADATNSALTLTKVQTNSAGSYSALVTNSLGSVVSSNAALTVAIPPAITTQPQSQVVIKGDDVSLSVEASGTTPLGYRWARNGTAISGGTNSALILGNVQTNSAGSYTVAVTNFAGSVTSAVAALTVLTPPAIQTQPTDLTVMQGLSAAFSVGATGTAPLGYQWSLNATNISGATNASLAWSNVQLAQAGQYSVVITNYAESITSAVATLSVIAVPPGSYVEAVITNRPLAYWRLDEPSGTTAFDYVGGNDATYANVTLNKPGALATDGDPAAGFNGTSAYAGTGVSLANNRAAFTMEGWYKLTAGGTRMGIWGQNNAIEFGLSDAKTIQIYTAGGGSLNVTNLWGTNSWHHVAAVGNGTNLLLYVDGVLAGTGGSATANYGSSTYPFNIGGGGIFDPANNWFNGCLDEVAFYNRALPATDIKRHYLLGLALPALTLTAPTNNATFAAPATINVAATVVTNGHTITKVQFFNGATLLTEDLAAPYKYTWNDIGAGIYNVSAVAIYDSGSVTSSVAVVTTCVAPGIQTQPQDLTVTQGQSASFSVVANGSAPFGYQWNLNGSPVAGATDALLTLPSAQATDAGSYTVVVTNLIGSATSAVATLAINVPPGITTQPLSQVVTRGQNASFSVVASGTAPLSYQWSLNGTGLPGATAPTLALSNVQTTDAGSYTVVVTNSADSVTSAVAALTVNLPPGITTQPLSQTTTQAQGASFSVVATGTGPLSYQWSLNGVGLPGATAPTLALTNVQTADAGGYTVAVTNSWGSVTSELAMLTVLAPPTFATQPQAQTVMAGQTATFSVVASGTAPLSYQWSLNGTGVPGATISVLTLTNLQATNAGSYTVVVANSAGSSTSAPAMLAVTNPPPPAPPILYAARMTSNGFTLRVSVPVGRTYAILATTNLKDWSMISTNVAQTGTELVTDSAATNFGMRFYRAVVR